MRNKGLIVSAGCGLALLASGCASTSTSNDTSASGDRTVVTTTTILGSIAEQVTECAGGTVTTLMPRGVDPHDYSPSSTDVVTMIGADLVVANGLGLEEGLTSALENAREDGANVYEVAPNVDPLPFSEEPESDEVAHEEEEAEHSEDEADHDAEGEGHGEDEADHEHGDLDPHVWMDAARMAQAAQLIGDQLADATGDANYRSCGSEAGASLQETNQQVTAAMADIPPANRKLITDHDSLGYFAAAYDFEVEGVVIPGGSTLGQPDSAELAKLAKLVKDENIPAIFVSEGASPALADALAAEVGEEVKVVTLYVGSVGPEGSDAATYQGMMTSDARAVAGALTP